MHIFIDLIILVLIGLSIWRGWKRGFIAGLLGFFAVFIAIFGARIAADALSPTFAGHFESISTSLVERVFQDTQDDLLEQGEIGDAAEAYEKSMEGFSRMGMFQGIADQLSRNVAEKMDEVGTKIRDAMVEALCNFLSYAVVFLVSFLLLMCGLTILTKLLDKITKIPILHQINAVGGLAVGLLEGLFTIWVFAWSTQFIGLISIGNTVLGDVFGKTVLLKWFIDLNIF